MSSIDDNDLFDEAVFEQNGYVYFSKEKINKKPSDGQSNNRKINRSGRGNRKSLIKLASKILS